MKAATQGIIAVLAIVALVSSVVIGFTLIGTSQTTSALTSMTTSPTAAGIVQKGTAYEQAAIQTRRVLVNGSIEAISNGTTVTFNSVIFTFIAKNWNCACLMNLFKVASPAGQWSESLQISQPVTSGEINQVYTNHSDPRVGLSMEYNSTLVYLLVSTYQSESPTTGCAESTSSTSNLMATVYHVKSTRAVLCVSYKFQGDGTADFFTTVQPWYQTGTSLPAPNSQCTSTEGCPIITASPSSAYHVANAVVSVTYTITSRQNLSGLYILFNAGCNPIYLAFGSSLPSTVYLTAWTCGPSNALSGGYRSGNYSITAVTGLETAFAPWA